MASNNAFNRLSVYLLSENSRKKSERIILNVAILSFVTHLLLIFLSDFGILHIGIGNELLTSPIAAIYTPFSFILIYEVYLLIFYLPKSFTTYISKQYEIIVLIIIRRLFKDFSSLSITPDWFKIKYDLQFTYDIIAALVLFFLIYLFRKEGLKRYSNKKMSVAESEGLLRFIKIKKSIASLLIPLIFIVSVYSLINWLWIALGTHDGGGMNAFRNINNVFFEQFFTILIVVDVVLLLFSFFHTDEFHKIIRNSGFIISTILIRLSFSVEGLLNTLLIAAAIVFGLLLLIIYNKYESQSARHTESDLVTEEN